jgi:hypothetical protein
VPDPGIGNAANFLSTATSGGVTVVSGELTIQPAFHTGYETTWATMDGVHWQLSDVWADLQDQHYHDITVVPFGRQAFAAFASTDDLGGPTQRTDVYTSLDGNRWTITSFLDGVRIKSAAALGERLVAVGMDEDYLGGIWLSSDAHAWERANDLAMTSVTVGSRVAAYGGLFVLFSPVSQLTPDLVDLWVSNDFGASWSASTHPLLPEAVDSDDRGLLHASVVGGPRGWVAAGWFYASGQPTEFAWWSPDGSRWESARVGPHDVKALVGYQDGFVAAGFHGTSPCCANSGEGQGVTWISPDGLTWERVRDEGQKDQDLQALAINGQTLIGLSVNNSSDVVTPAAVWLGNLTRFGQN